MSENTSKPSSCSKGRMSLFTPVLKSAYDIRKLYPEDYKDTVEQEIRQWGELSKAVSEEADSLRENLSKSDTETVKIDVESLISSNKCYEDLFDHSLYYDYLHIVDKFCKKVACAVELCKVEKQVDDRKRNLLRKKMILLDKMMQEDIKKYF